MASGKKEKEPNGSEDERYSDWMCSLPPDKHNIPLWHLVIPGSHDSMSYNLDINSSIIEPDMLKKYSSLCCVRSLLMKWGKTQEANITEQLNAGARYFDLRIARKENDPDPNRLYFYHGLLTRTDVETVLTSINAWAELHPREVIILALSHFKGFGSGAEQQHLHKHLTSFITTLFSSRLVPKPVSNDDPPTLQKCWDNKYNVIVSYDYSEANTQPQFWFKILYFYGDSMDPSTIEKRLSNDVKIASSAYFYICGLNLTLPENSGALKFVCGFKSLASVIRKSLPELLKWTETETETKDAKKLNIVASDLVTEDNVVATIVQLNTVKDLTV
ncbi:PI-PLC X domain-containing protein 1-like [Eucyclogobius newberryi]|uniref:PI-PLC X domain-containing protein 1-like n=1 Tax=Eucyclogobius newberryi TaxID=166745 RepID=UPI003B5C0342